MDFIIPLNENKSIKDTQFSAIKNDLYAIRKHPNICKIGFKENKNNNIKTSV